MRRKIKFLNTKGPDFFKTLRRRVDDYFSENKLSKHANVTMVIKTITMLGLYFIPYFLLFTNVFTFFPSLLLFMLMGIGMAGIGVSVMHDANHGAYSSNNKINKILGYTLNMVGATVYIWKLQHNIKHHSYTNIYSEDKDVDGRYIFRFSPHGELKKIHRFQHIYAIPFYGLLTLSWMLVNDFIHFLKNDLNTKNRKVFLRETLILIASKLLYFTYMILLPLLFLDLTWWQFVIGFILMHFTAGIILSIIFQLAHVVEGTSHPLPNKQGNMENEWAIHQMHNTVNFGTNNKSLTWFAGGLNFQVEHHLFPDVCHVHYKRISAIVKRTAEEYKIPYLENSTFIKAFMSHLRLLKKLGRESTGNVA